jgi:hypothetical protein
MTRLPTLAIAALALSLAACAAKTTLSEVWVAPGVKASDYYKVLVIAVTPNPARRMGLEDAMARRIAGSTASHTLMTLAELADRAKVQAKLKEQGYDGVLVVRLLAMDVQQSQMSEDAAMLNPNAGLYGYWDPAHHAWDADHVVTSRNITMETMFFDVATAERKFRAQSETYDPADQEKLVDSLFDAIRAELKKSGVL